MTDFKDADIANGNIPNNVSEELNLNVWLSWIGEQFYNLSPASKRKLKDYMLAAKTAKEEFAEETVQFHATFHTEGNILRSASRGKQFFYYGVAIITTLIEYFVYRNIAENVLGMPINETYIVAFFSLVFTKFIQIVFQRRIQSFLSENSRKLRSLIKTLLYVFTVLILINAVMAGITNLLNIDYQKKIEQVEILSEQIQLNQEGDNSALEADLQKAQSELVNENSAFLLLARFCAVTLLGLLAIVCGAVLWSVADLYTYALKLQKRRQNLKDDLAQLQANFYSYIQIFDDMISLQKDLLMLYGQKALFRKTHK